MSSPISHWRELATPPSHAKVLYKAPDGRSPLTPAGVRERYDAEAQPLTTVIWRAGDIVGIKSGIDEVSWEYKHSQSVRVAFRKPAKGAGEVLLDVVGAGRTVAVEVIRCVLYDEAHYRWVLGVADALTRAARYVVERKDRGLDA